MPRVPSRRLLAFFGSFGLAAALLILLLLLTFLGTLEQQYDTIYEVQENYFQSVFLVHYVGGKYPIPLPGRLPRCCRCSS